MTKRGSAIAAVLRRTRAAALAAMAAFGLAAPAMPAAAGGFVPLIEIARPGPWPGVSRLIAFDGGIWFVNSDPFADVNAADVYRYDPAQRTVRYQRGLFSQHAGAPAVFRGRLFWPFEDPRSNAAVGEFAVTDGTRWRWEVMGAGITLHVHAMYPCRGALLAGAGGWNGALHASPDGVRQWREVHRLPDNADGFSRITTLGSVGERCFFASGDSGDAGQRLFEWTERGARPLDGWPDAIRVSALTGFRGALVGVIRTLDGTSLWRLGEDGAAEELPLPEDHSTVEALAADGERLYMLTSREPDGALWAGDGGPAWTLLQRFGNERPIDLLLLAGGDIYVGTHRRDGRGGLWGPAAPRERAPGPGAVALDAPAAQTLEKEVMDTSLRTLETALAPKPDYMSFRTGLLGVALPLAETRNPLVGVLLAKRARKALPAGEVATFADQKHSVETLARWLLLYSAGLTGSGYVPPEWLVRPWQAAPRPTEKYFETTLAAIRAAGRFRQNSVETLDALVARLDSRTDPLWLTGDVVAALTEITGQRFGHDLTAWKAWWADARATWQPRPLPAEETE